MVRFKVIDNRLAITNKIDKVILRLQETREAFLNKVAERVIVESPVDTGTYITSHHFVEGNAGSEVTTSHGKPRKQPWQPYADEGLEQLTSEIGGLGENIDQIKLYNGAVHAVFVEEEYAPYTITRSVADQLFIEAWEQTK